MADNDQGNSGPGRPNAARTGWLASHRTLLIGGGAAVLLLVVAGVGLGLTRSSTPGPAAAFASSPAVATDSASPTPLPSPPVSSAPALAHPVPGGFTTTDLSFISATQGWALGTAPCSRPPCTSLLRTSDGGAHWSGGPAPVAPLTGTTGCTAAAACIGSVRFADARHGYAFGGALLTTSDAGQSWAAQPGPYVDALEPVGGEVMRVVHDTSACPPGCTFSVQRASVGSTTWTPVATPTLQGNAVRMVRQGRSVYLLLLKNPAGGAGSAHPQFVLSHDDGASWVQRDDPCGPSVSDSPQERDASAAVAAPDGSVTLLCTQRSTGAGSVAVSPDGGGSFRAPAPLPAGVRATGVAATSGSRLLVTGTTAAGTELLLSTDTGATWKVVASSPGAARGSAGAAPFLAFTTSTVGTATLPGGSQLWRTEDGGTTWATSGFHG